MCGVDHGLVREAQAAVAQGALHALAQGHADAMTLPLLVGNAVGNETVATGPFGFGQRSLGAGHDLVRGFRLLGIGRAADRDGGVDRAGTGVDRHLADRAEHLLGHGRDGVLGTVGEHDAEAVATHAADHVAHAEAAVETLTDLDDDLIRGLVAEDVIDAGELVDADGEIGAGETGAGAVREHVIERLAQAPAVEMAGQLVVVRNMLEPLLLGLARGDGAQHAQHSPRPAHAIEFGRAALVQPREAAIAESNAIFDVEGRAAAVMALQALLPHDEIVGIDARGEALAARDRGFLGEAQHARRAVPLHGVAVEVPYIGGIAGSGESSQDAGQGGGDVRDHGRASTLKRIERTAGARQSG